MTSLIRRASLSQCPALPGWPKNMRNQRPRNALCMPPSEGARPPTRPRTKHLNFPKWDRGKSFFFFYGTFVNFPVTVNFCVL